MINPSQLAGLNPSANVGGNNTPMVQAPGGINTPALGGAASPFTPTITTGIAMPPVTSPAPIPYTPSGSTANLINPGGPGGTNVFGRDTGVAGQDEIAKNLQKAGFKGGIGTALSQFLSSGAGFNPQVAQALIDAMQPQFREGEANLMEQYGSHGLAGGSPAALGLGNYLAEENLKVGQLLSGMYEQSVTDYLSVLSGGKIAPQKGFGESFKEAVGSGLGNLLTGGHASTTSDSSGASSSTFGIG